MDDTIDQGGVLWFTLLVINRCLRRHPFGSVLSHVYICTIMDQWMNMSFHSHLSLKVYIKDTLHWIDSSRVVTMMGPLPYQAGVTLSAIGEATTTEPCTETKKIWPRRTPCHQLWIIQTIICFHVYTSPTTKSNNQFPLAGYQQTSGRYVLGACLGQDDE